jgi:hypothetical protein
LDRYSEPVTRDRVVEVGRDICVGLALASREIADLVGSTLDRQREMPLPLQAMFGHTGNFAGLGNRLEAMLGGCGGLAVQLGKVSGRNLECHLTTMVCAPYLEMFKSFGVTSSFELRTTLISSQTSSIMPAPKHGARSLLYCSRCLSQQQTARASFQLPVRRLTTSSISHKDVQEMSAPSSSTSNSTPLDPALVHTHSQERRLIRDFKQYPIGSRRRRAAISASSNIPFEQLPYQCFQEARKILAESREEKVEAIELQRGRITRLLEQDPAVSGGEPAKQVRLASMRKQLEKLKIYADINDPMVKKMFEDGLGTFKDAWNVCVAD